jgi:hypothetical protein
VSIGATVATDALGTDEAVAASAASPGSNAESEMTL